MPLALHELFGTPMVIATGTITAFMLGSAMGTLALLRRVSSQHVMENKLISFVFIVARDVVPFFVAGHVYLRIGGVLPLPNDIVGELHVLAAYALLYLAGTLVLFALHITFNSPAFALASSRLRLPQGSLTLILMLPVPFALGLSTVARADESFLLFTLTAMGGALTIFALYGLNQSQLRLQRQIAEMQSIGAASQALRAQLELGDLLRTIYQQISRLLNTPNVTVALLDENGYFTYPLVIRGGVEIAVDARRGPTDDVELIRRVIVTGQPLLLTEGIAAYAALHNLTPPQQHITSWLGVPIISRDETLGAFVVFSKEDERHFNENDLRLMNIFVAGAGIALENARLYMQQQYRAEQLATLNALSQQVTHSLSFDEVLDAVLNSAAHISRAQAVAVYVQEGGEKENGLRLVRSQGLNERLIAQPPPTLQPDRLPSTDSLAPQPLTVPDVNKQALPSEMSKALAEAGIRAWVTLPLTQGNLRIGTLALYYQTPQVFRDELLELLQAYATQVAQAVANARIFATTDRELELRVHQMSMLAEMVQLLSGTLDNPRVVYDVVLSYAMTASSAEHGVIIAVEQDGSLSAPTSIGYPDDFFVGVTALRDGLLGQTLRSGQVIRCDDTHADPSCPPLLPNTRSILVVPIARGLKVAALIVLESERVVAFSAERADFMLQIATQGVIALDKAQLFRDVRAARDDMAVVLNAIEEGTLLLNPDGQIVQANPRLSLLGLRYDALLYQQVTTLLDENENLPTLLGFEDRAAIEGLLEQLELESGRDALSLKGDLKGDEPQASSNGHGEHAKHDAIDLHRIPPHTYMLDTPETQVVIERQIIPIDDEQGQIIGLLLIYYNKTEEAELERARQMFSRMVIHDLRSPLAAVTASLRLLQELSPREGQFADMLAKTFEMSQRAIRKVLTRVDSLLDIARMESGDIDLEYEPTSLPHLVQIVQTDLQPLAKELEITLVTDMPADLPLLNVDTDKVERLLMNLVDNALKHSPANTTVTIQARPEPDGQLMRIAVIDEGPGIPDNYKQRLFEQFVQVEGRKGHRRGIGLGLTFCKLVTESHGGRIWIEDNPQGGSVFAVTLPILNMPEPVE